MKTKLVGLAIILVIGFLLILMVSPRRVVQVAQEPLAVSTWQGMASPGELSMAHGFLDKDCAACHTPVSGIESVSCVTCHANDESILKRQPTAFHANVTSCKQCHLEHQGKEALISRMDHEALFDIGLKEFSKDFDPQSEGHILAQYLKVIESNSDAQTKHSGISTKEAALDCTTCHQNDDRHFDLFGNDCATCHGVNTWNISEFRHPSPASMDCAQCHQAPPSHYMMHFQMISQKVAGEPHAQVNQCYVCHQTTSWPDIKKAGWYKHH